MSVYEVNFLCRRIARDPDLRAQLQADPVAALGELDLTYDERRLLLDGDVAGLYELGVNEYLLMALARFGVLGLDPRSFSDRIRQAQPHIPG
jgi:hypothetical protein